MSRLDAFAKAVAGDAGRCALTVLCILTAVAWGAVAWERRQKPVPILTVGVGGDVRPAERYLLPITPPLDQGNSGLCWVFAALSMLETNYMSRHPGAHVEFSRAAVQRDLIRRPLPSPDPRRAGAAERRRTGGGGASVRPPERAFRPRRLPRRSGLRILFASLGQKLAGPAAAGDKERELHDPSASSQLIRKSLQAPLMEQACITSIANRSNSRLKRTSSPPTAPRPSGCRASDISPPAPAR